MRVLESWGRYPRVKPGDQRVLPISWRTEPLPMAGPGCSVLPFGLGRSYGDGCLNRGQALIPTSGLDRFIDFDPASGLLTCEAGVSLDDILRLVVWQGWFLPVTPGTRFVTIGGAIANDVHGKNHHTAGTFGRHVRRFELLRSDGTRRVCSPTENADWFAATIGGLGLTGLITWAEIQLARMHNPFILQETVPFGDLEEFFRINQESERDFVYTVAWVDCLARGRKLGRGLYYRGNPAPPRWEALPLARSRLTRRGGLSVPFNLPSFTLNRLTVSAFNFLYYHRQRGRASTRLVHYDPFFYPLDSVYAWNRIYGRRGFLQFQCVVPLGEAESGAMRELLTRISRSGMASFLAVLKTFGALESPGMLSFPRPGVTLALDFAFQGERTLALFSELERTTREAGGAVYPAKDACMTPESFAAAYPELPRFRSFVDPAFSSSLWRRVMGTPDASTRLLPGVA
jgi:FAD/FMN-containing dehydrogenase